MDRDLYKQYMQETIFNYKNLSVKASSVEDLMLDESVAGSSAVCGVILGI